MVQRSPRKREIAGSNPAWGFVIKMVKIRVIGPKDLMKIMVIENLSFKYPYTERIFLNYYERYRDGFFVAEKKDIVGYIMNNPERKEIDSIAVHPEHRRRGIGSILLKKSYEYFKKKGEDEIFIHVRKSNKIAQAFYEHHGFVNKRTIPDYYIAAGKVEDGIEMKKELS